MTLTHTRQSLNADAALQLVGLACAGARGAGLAVAVAVVDDAGRLKAFCAMDGAPLVSTALAQDKAYTAAAFGLPTDEWHPALEGAPALLLGLNKAERFTVLGGGLPLRHAGALIGGIGVSGASAEEDRAIAAAALAGLLGG